MKEQNEATKRVVKEDSRSQQGSNIWAVISGQ